MRTILAYIIVIVLGQFCLTIGVLIVGMACSFLLMMLPEKIRGLISTFVAGLAGSLLAIGFAYLVFKWVVGENSFGLFPFLAAVLSLTIPILNDFKKYRQLKNLQGEMAPIVAKITGRTTSGFGTTVLGEVVGIIVGALCLTFL